VLNIPVFIFIATGETHFRKPSKEMWNFFVKNCNQTAEVNLTDSFYVGDAGTSSFLFKQLITKTCLHILFTIIMKLVVRKTGQ
jgi:histidinol phosphatase-like enzyme